MGLFRKQALFCLTLLSSFCLPFITSDKNPIKVDSDLQFAPEGMVAYAASYSSEPTNEPKYSTQNNKTFQYLNLGKTLDYYRGDSVKVGIIDSGINYDHEDFMVSGSTKVKGDSKYYTYQSSSWVYYKASQHGYSYIDDTLGHGTNVAATVAAAINSVGGLGLAPNVELYVYKVTNSSNGYEFGAIQNALMDAKTLGLDVINMSFQSYEHAVSYNGSTMGASSGCSTIMSYYLNQAYNAGITLVGAAGNYNTDEPSYPGSNNYVINVGSLDSTGTGKAGFSNYGSTIDLVAPGYVHVADEASNTAYTNTQGTSFSAPLVTAAIALYIQQNPSATPAQIESALYASCDPIDDSGSEYTNWAGNGALNVARFLGVEETDVPTSIVVNNPEIVNDELELEVGDTFDLDWTVNGVGTFDDSVTFSLYEDNGTLSINSNGRITALKEGEEVVTIESTVDSNVSADIYVTVSSSGGAPTLSSISVQTAPNKVTYNVGDYFNPTGLVIRRTYSDSSTDTYTYSGHTSEFSFTPSTSTALTKNDTSIIITYDGLTCNQAITVNRVLSSISVSTAPTKTTYTAGECFDPTGLVITKTYTDSPSETYTYANHTSEFSFTPSISTALTIQNNSVTISYGGKTCNQAITVNAAPASETLTITMNSFTNASATYAWYDWTQTTTDSTSISGKGELYKPDSSKMQFNKSKGNKVAAIFNTTAIPGSIIKIEATSHQTTIRSWTAYVTSTACSGSGSTLSFGSNKTTVGTVSPAVGSSTSFGTSNAGYSYFCIQENDSSASYISEFKITYTPKSLSNISVKTAPTKISYEAGENFDPTGLVITKTFSDNTTVDVPYAGNAGDFTFNPTTSTALTTSDVSVVITYGGKSCSQAITVTSAKTLSSITISGYTTSLVEGDVFSFGGTVTAHYSDSSSNDVTSSASFSGYNMTVLGSQTVTVSYTYKGVTKEASYSLTINQGTLSSISVSGMTTNYIKNYAFSFDGTCTATFANGYQKVVTPTSVTSPDMSTAGNKTITVSYTYNGNTKSTDYQISVASNRTVIEEVTTPISSTISYPTSSTPSISGQLGSVTASATGKTVYESSSLRLGTNNGGGTITISSTSTITRVEVSAKYYSSNYSSSILKVNGTSVGSLSSSYSSYSMDINPGKTSFTILTENSSSRVNIQSITLYSSTTTEADISTSEDCLGLELFIDTYMHMDYTQNLGYCSDSEHHYYSTAKTAFNNLNEHQRTLFTSNSAYNVEWTRLSTWASKNGDTLNSSSILAAGKLAYNKITQGGISTAILVVIGTSTLSIAVAYFLFRKKKQK